MNTKQSYRIEYRNSDTRNRWLVFARLHNADELENATQQAKAKAGKGDIKTTVISEVSMVIPNALF